MKNLVKSLFYLPLLAILLCTACTDKETIKPAPGNGSQNPGNGGQNPQDPNNGQNPNDPKPEGTLFSKLDWGGGAFTELNYNGNKQIVQIREVNNANIWTYKLFYDANNRLDYVRLNDFGRILYEYEGDQIVKIVQINGTTSIYEHDLTYNAQNQIVERYYFKKLDNGERKVISRSTYAYDAQGNLIKFQLYLTKAESEELQLVKTVIYSNFDDKINVERFLHFKPLFFHKFFKNNPKTVQTIDEQGFTPNYIETYKYTYNSKNMPKQLEVVYKIDGLNEVRGNAFLSYIQ
jgi:hypothetical protein